jgi:hypothetical protein
MSWLHSEIWSDIYIPKTAEEKLGAYIRMFWAIAAWMLIRVLSAR